MPKPIRFGKYYLLERINVGGMAEVFKAKAVGVEGFERLVAVKRILPNIAEDEEFITMFVDEAKIAVQLTHANIAQIFDLGKVNDAYFIALEYVHGKDARALFNRARNRGERIPMPLACYVIMKVCEALDYAHNKKDASGNPLKFVHRDVSPQNVLVSYEGEVKVIDFGIAKAAGKASKTRAGILKGKFGYMSPEQVKGMDIDRRSDIFGVGICLYEMLTGERLFAGESDFSTVEKVRKVDIMPPSTYNRRIPEDLERIVLKALAGNLTERYQTATELHDDLQAFVQSSGNDFNRKELASFMKSYFAEELAQESARDKQYAAMKLSDEEEEDDPDGFDELVAAGTPSSVGSESGRAPASNPSARGSDVRSQPRKRTPTLLGMPQNAHNPHGVGSNPGMPRVSTPKPAVPRLVPRPHSIPPGNIPTPRRPPAPSASAARLDMDWDDEELSTQIYDKPESPLPQSSPVFAPRPAPYQSQPQVYDSLPVPAPVPADIARQVVPSPYPDQRGRRLDEPTDVIPEEVELISPRPRSGPRVLGVIGAMLALVVTAAVAAFVFMSREEESSTIFVRTAPPDAEVKIDGKRVSGERSPYVITNVKPGVAHLIEVGKSGFEPWTANVVIEPGKTEQRYATLKPVESGFALDSKPSAATVFVDDSELAQKTPVRVTALSPGTHRIRVVGGTGYAPWETQIHVVSGTVLELPTAELLPESGEEEPPKTTRREKPQPPRPTIEGPSKPIQPTRKKKSGPAVLLAKGKLRINTRPWSQVYVDGKLIGNTSQMGIPLTPGRHRVKLVNSQFGIQKTLSVDIPAGETVTRILTLTPGM